MIKLCTNYNMFAFLIIVSAFYLFISMWLLFVAIQVEPEIDAEERPEEIQMQIEMLLRA